MKIQRKICRKNRIKFNVICTLVYFLISFFIINLTFERSCYSTTTVRFGISALPNHPWTEGIEELKKQVEQNSMGNIKIDIAGTSLKKPNEFLSC